MLIPSVLLAVIGLLGAFDIAWFHTWKGRLVARPECRAEAIVHVVRGFVYSAQFVVVPNLELRGRWILGLLLLFVIDVVVGITDIALEPKSRAKQGGLTGSEYLIHMILSVLVGAELCSIAHAAWSWPSQATALVVVSHVPFGLRVLLGAMAAGALACAVLEALLLWEARQPKPAPIHVRVRLRGSLERVWNTTQDHRLHPTWDHRFDRIVMSEAEAWAGPLGVPDPRITTGTTMGYEKSVLGVTIRGFGRYQLHKPMRQSTFAFGSDDRRSLIRGGVGLWLSPTVRLAWERPPPPHGDGVIFTPARSGVLGLSVYALVGLWAATLAVGLAALRMARGRGRAIALPSLFLGAWVSGLVLLETGTYEGLAERVLCSGRSCSPADEARSSPRISHPSSATTSPPPIRANAKAPRSMRRSPRSNAGRSRQRSPRPPATRATRPSDSDSRVKAF